MEKNTFVNLYIVGFHSVTYYAVFYIPGQKLVMEITKEQFAQLKTFYDLVHEEILDIQTIKA